MAKVSGETWFIDDPTKTVTELLYNTSKEIVDRRQAVLWGENLNGGVLLDLNMNQSRFKFCEMWNLSAANSNLTNSRFQYCEATRSTFLDCELDYSSFFHCDLSRCVFEGCTAQGTTFEHCTMQGTRLNLRTGPCQFRVCCLGGATIELEIDADSSVAFIDCSLLFSQFSKISGGSLHFQNCDLLDTDLSSLENCQITMRRCLVYSPAGGEGSRTILPGRPRMGNQEVIDWEYPTKRLEQSTVRREVIL